jgi:hypothetical protein
MEQLKHAILSALSHFEEHTSAVYLYPTNSDFVMDVELRHNQARFRFEAVLDDRLSVSFTENRGFSPSFEKDFIPKITEYLSY